MTKYLVEESTLTDIADAIREQTGDENPIMLSNFASQIGSIQGGGSVNYSTTEHEVGTWIDGSTVYEKVIELGTLPDNNTKNIPHGIVNLGLIITASAIASDPNEATIPIPYTVSDGNYLRFQTGFSIDGTNISITCGSNRTGYTGIAILRYTKSAQEVSS